MRVERALDKRRGILAKRGVRSTSSALASGLAFASEAQMQNDQPISWYCHADADYSHAGDRRLELHKKGITNLNQQTSLTFALARRFQQVWLLKDLWLPYRSTATVACSNAGCDGGAIN